MHATGQFLIPVALMLLIVYRRVKRTIGFQPYRPRRLTVRIAIFAVIGVLLLGAGFVHPILYLADAAGLVCGGVLAYFAIRHSKFEFRGGELHYRTHIWIETIVVALFIGRIAYRLLFVFTAGQQAASGDQMQQYTRDPWTALIFFLIVAYYIGFYLHVLKEGRRRGADRQLR
jgi:TRAP-type mannitol/chloroaromatic compound transport system permease large subunit